MSDLSHNLSEESLNETPSTLHPNSSASQLESPWRLNQTFSDRRRRLQEDRVKIASEFPLLKFLDDTEYIQWSIESEEQFDQWWEQTSTGESIINRTQKKFAHPRWCKKIGDGNRERSSLWNYFTQVASIINGTPKIACNSCGKILNHPTASDQSNTSNLKKHLQSERCSFRKRQGDIIGIDVALQRVGLSR